MTSSANFNAADDFDSGPLSWVMEELRITLGRTRAMLAEALAEHADADARGARLRQAKAHMHQAHGALQMIDVDGVSILAETIENLFDRFAADQQLLNSEAAHAIDQACTALVEYLEELLTSARPQAVRLFPYYHALLHAGGAERIHPADLFFPNLAIRPVLPQLSAHTAADSDLIDYVAQRKRFEKALLPFLKRAAEDRVAPGGSHGQPDADAEQMHQVIADVARAQTNPQSRAFWWVMRGFAEAVAVGDVPTEVYVKQLFARINLQIRRISEGSSSIAERVLRDALFFIAKVAQPSTHLRQIRDAYCLEGLVPPDFEEKRYGLVDVAALAAAREKLSKAKNLWGRIAGGDASAATTFEHDMHALSDAGEKLNAPALAKLLRELNGIARAAANAKPGDRLGLEMATSLLFVENALSQISALPANFTERAEAMTARLLSIVAGETVAAATPWLDDMSRQAQQRQTIGALTGELQSSLRQVEKILEGYFADPSDAGALVPVEAILHQVGGALSVLDQDDAARAVVYTRNALHGFAQADPAPDPAIAQPVFQKIARNIGALGFFIESLQLTGEVRKKRYYFDDKAGLFQPRTIERGAVLRVDVPDDLSGPVFGVVPMPASASGPRTVTELPRNAAHALPDSGTLPPAALALGADLHAAPDPASSVLTTLPPSILLSKSDELDGRIIVAPVTNDSPGWTQPDAGGEPTARDDIPTTYQRGVEHTRSVSAPMVADTRPDASTSFVLAPSLPTVEEDLLRHQHDAGRLAEALAADIGNAQLCADLKQALHEVRRDASLIDHPVANEQVRTVLALLGEKEFCTRLSAPAELLQAMRLAVPGAATDASAGGRLVLSPESDEEIDAELLEIFLGEAVEVLDAVRRTLPAAQREPHNQEHLTTLRRSFHTLKGSGRMVGLTALGEAAWSIEQVLNLRLSDTRCGDAELYHLLEQALATLGRWVDELQSKGRSDCTPGQLIAAAARLRLGLSQDADDEGVVTGSPGVPVAATDEADYPTASVAESQTTDSALLAADSRSQELDQPDQHRPLFDQAQVALITDTAEVGRQDDFDVAAARDGQDGSWSSGPATPYPSRADEGVSDDAFATGQLTGQPILATDDGLLLSPAESATLEAGARTTRADPASSVIGFPTPVAPPLQRNDNLKQIGPIEISVALHNIYLTETDALVRVLALDIDEWRHEPARTVNVVAVNAAHSLAGTSATVGFKPLQDIAHELEIVLQQLARTPVRLLDGEFDTLAEVVARIRFMLQLFALNEMADPEPLQVLCLKALQHAIAARAEGQSLQRPLEAVPPVEPNFAALLSRKSVESDRPPLKQSTTAPADGADPVPASRTNSERKQDWTPAPAPAPTPELAPLPALSPGTDPGGPSDLTPQSASTLKDELDPDLMPVFIEEATDMLPQVGSLLRDWQQAPADAAAPQSLLRLLHTVKGSARMAGAMRLGQHMHEMESRIEQVMHASHQSPQVMDNLLARYDHGLQMFEALQKLVAGVADVVTSSFGLPESRTATVAADRVAPHTDDTVPRDANARGGDNLLSGSLPERRRGPRFSTEITTPAAPVPLVRVRADILDRLVNQTGEISISRSRLETEVDAMRQSLTELGENVARLREQLREVEMQAESQIENQIISQRNSSVERAFDPLEFDRFTRLQELTRMMAESVNDVGSVEQNLSRTLDTASADLSTQARLTRDLQQDLMSVRMIQFASITERLYRVSRQASKEVDKRVNLDIRGGTVEIDRSVLEKMAGPFEHLLRNAIVHGIESRIERAAAGKNDVGELLVEVRQEGNEVVIQFSDDGQGLNLERIRDKALHTGLLGAGQLVSDTELTDLIFHPGFSTAAAVTELAGRGVGMDVVRAEAGALGGRVSILSQPGKGAQFTVHLPLTLAVTQVVLLTTGGKTYAVPSVLVEQVQQLKTAALSAAYNEGAIMWQSQPVPLVYLASLLGDTGTNAVAQQYSPLVILKSGGKRIAIHVDEILGNREVVVKNVGPQLARLTGIAGATVLGSGEIVLILNPLALVQRAVQEGAHVLAAAPIAGTKPEAVAQFEQRGEAGGAGTAAPVGGLRTQKIVMVVDDSLTVRRVTQRLLSREGYQVVLAKDGVDALEQLQSVTPDVMLVDIEMPRMDGFDLTRNVRDGEGTCRIPIIMITSRTASKHRNYAFELGVNEYVGKPFQEDVLLSMIAGFVGRDAPVV